MSETVYLLGAGVNRGLTNAKGLKPPLDGDFFQLLAAQGYALPREVIPRGSTVSHHRLRPGGAVPPVVQASDPGNIYWVYGFIQRFWERSPDDLAATPFGLEELLTFLQLQREEARKSKDHQKAEECLFTELVLEHRLLAYLYGFSDVAKSSPELTRFGSIIYAERSTVITTNYDFIVEAVIDKASRDNLKANIGESVPAPAWSAKNSCLVKFSATYGDRESERLHPLMLKLHGSLTWGSVAEKNAGTLKAVKSLLFYNDQELRDYLDLGPGLLYKPLIVPMTLYKREYYGHPAIKKVWSQAQKELSECQNLVVIGYSFPSTDFHIKKLFLEALSKRELKSLAVVNPDTSVVQRVKDLTHFQKPVMVCKDIGEFLK